MTDAALLRSVIDASGHSARGFARLLDVDERSVRRWLADEVPMPGAVRILCRLLIERPEVAHVLADWAEMPRLA